MRRSILAYIVRCVLTRLARPRRVTVIFVGLEFDTWHTYAGKLEVSRHFKYLNSASKVSRKKNAWTYH